MAKSKSAEPQQIVIPEIKTPSFLVTIEGDSPLITHKFSEKQKRQMADAQQGKATMKKAPKDPKAEYESCFYRLPDGKTPGFPTGGIKKAMVRACSLVENVPMTLMRMAVFVSPGKENGSMLAAIHFKSEEMVEDNVRLGGKTADLRYRPYFSGWSMLLKITHNANVITQEQVVNLLNLAGFSVGIGDWRPEKDGNAGRFHVAIGGKK
jgi:hypothetical protein